MAMITMAENYAIYNAGKYQYQGFTHLHRRHVLWKSFGGRSSVAVGSGCLYGNKAIHAEIDGSLKRLGVDYVDLYQIHRFDYNTPIEETRLLRVAYYS